MLYNKQLITIGLLAIIPTLGCANTARKTVDSAKTHAAIEAYEGKNVTNTAAREAKAHNFVEIEFIPGSSTLSDNAKKSIDNVVEQSKQSGKIDEVMVLSWADEEFPSTQLEHLSKPQRNLADQRNKSVSDYLKYNRSLSIDTYNMAQQPNALSKFFNTSDSRLKKSFTAAGLPTSADSHQFPSKASHSVILVKIE